jgi:hypothetical protein
MQQRIGSANMTGQQYLWLVDLTATDLAAEIRAALAQMAKAHHYAHEVRSDPWEFAVEIERLIDLGLTTSDLRWLVKKGYIEHAREITYPGDGTRAFLPIESSTAFTSETCFVLSNSGLLLARSACDDCESSNFAKDCSSAQSGPAFIPRWDGQSRALYLGEQIVKQYAVPAPNQEIVLTAFQEQQWAQYIDDPIPPAPEQNQKIRLRDTIKCLNAHQQNRLIRFHGNGTGERIRWELTEAGSLHLSAGMLRLRRAR